MPGVDAFARWSRYCFDGHALGASRDEVEAESWLDLHVPNHPARLLQSTIPATQWLGFKLALAHRLLREPSSRLALCSMSRSARTDFCTASLLPAMSGLLEVDLVLEQFRVDAMLCLRPRHRILGRNATTIPVVVIEFENEIRTAHEEIAKLSCLAMPLKIVFVTEPGFDEDPKSHFEVSGRRGVRLEEWSADLFAASRYMVSRSLYAIVSPSGCPAR